MSVLSDAIFKFLASHKSVPMNSFGWIEYFNSCSIYIKTNWNKWMGTHQPFVSSSSIFSVTDGHLQAQWMDSVIPVPMGQTMRWQHLKLYFRFLNSRSFSFAYPWHSQQSIRICFVGRLDLTYSRSAMGDIVLNNLKKFPSSLSSRHLKWAANSCRESMHRRTKRYGLELEIEPLFEFALFSGVLKSQVKWKRLVGLYSAWDANISPKSSKPKDFPNDANNLTSLNMAYDGEEDNKLLPSWLVCTEWFCEMTSISCQ